jgi:pimeloyl-ACP methyl ester carboxylesterase
MAAPDAVAGYVPLFAQAGLPTPAARIDVPLLAVTGEHDRDLMRGAAVTTFLKPLGEHLTVIPLADSGHYPMQEAPPRVVALLERFLGGASARDRVE